MEAKMYTNAQATLVSDVNDVSVGTIAKGTEVAVEGLWTEVTGGSWMNATGNFAAMNYGLRVGLDGLPIDDKVYYGKVGGLGFLFHETELVFS
jgi:hypothetical protein